MAAKVGPTKEFSPRGHKSKIVRRASLRLPRLLSHRNVPALDSAKFDELMSTDFLSGFEESNCCFQEITSKASDILGAEQCYIFILDEKQHSLYTYIEDSEKNQLMLTKPLDRGITGTVVSDIVGYNVHDVTTSNRWSSDLDEMQSTATKSYLAWPLWDVAGGNSIGVVEFRNKINCDTDGFDAADCQMARIVAFQLTRAIIHYRQQNILAGRNEAINKAYEKNFDSSEAITIADDEFRYKQYSNDQQNQSHLAKAQGKLRAAFALTPSFPWRYPGNVSNLSDRGWDYDVFLHTKEELTMHAVDVFDALGLFSNFSIPMATFVNFTNEIIGGYKKESPYHNFYHAFDVMHVCYLLITKCRADEYLQSFNILSILVAALAHDLGHDGFNNAFHETTNSELAVTYNGMSILENYSTAYLFRILRKVNCNIFSRLSRDEINKMRTRLIDLILDTDAKHHFRLVTRFKHGLEMKQLSRGLLSSMILHVSDVSNPTRPGIVARKWAYAVQKEFFRQGDREKELDLPRSPFMDRDFENLPRMQGAFIDALVAPIFRLLAEFLPLINENCIKTLQINRAFWNNMQNLGIVTTEDIVKHLKHLHVTEADYKQNLLYDDSTQEHDYQSSGGDIPGIPANAPKDTNQSLRKLSLISIHKKLHEDNLDPELGENRNNTSRQMSGYKGTIIIEKHNECMKKIRKHMSQILESNIFQLLTMIATTYALFANDINLIVGNKSTDHIIDVMTFMVLIMFMIEIMLSIMCVEKYIQFFFWLDVAASISLLLEIDFLLAISGESPDELSLAKAGRAAKAGARAGRLIRFVKIIKVLKLIVNHHGFKKSQNNEDIEIDEDVDMKMSIVGRKMTESITRKVIIAVMFMLAIFFFTDVSFTPDARQVNLNALAINNSSKILRDIFFESNPNLIQLTGCGDDFINVEKMQTIRKIAKLVLNADSDKQVSATFDLTKDTTIIAWYSIATTLIVTILLGALSMMFSRDAYNIMIRPIEKMKGTVQKLSENPLLHLERMRKRGVTESNETDILEQAITKMATLLQVGFGCAGAEIIAKSLSDVGELDPMVPGNKVNAIFGFCDIRDFTFATEGLQEDVMLFVNKIAEIIHRHVIDSQGAPNKNIGDAFLLVWKLKCSKNGSRSNLQKHLFDSALSCAQNVIAEIRQRGTLTSLLEEETHGISSRRSLDNFEVNLGFGLHTGWAIEGSIGSKVKVDASYLSPHVNLASRLEDATKQYHIPLLMSDAFVSGLTGSVQSTCRRVDKVAFKGSHDPMCIFFQDTEPIHKLQIKPKRYADFLVATSWKGEQELSNARVDIDPIIKVLQSERYLEIRSVYDDAFNAYLDGNWKKCKIIFHLWMEKFPGDVVVQVLVDYLMKNNFICPNDWPGYHTLVSK